MRFISIFTHVPTNRAPTEAEMTRMGNLIEEAMKEGWLIATEGVHFGRTRRARAQERRRQGHGDRRSVRRGQGSPRRLRAGQGRIERKGHRAHAPLPRRRGSRHLRDLPTVRDAGPLKRGGGERARSSLRGAARPRLPPRAPRRSPSAWRSSGERRPRTRIPRTAARRRRAARNPGESARGDCAPRYASLSKQASVAFAPRCFAACSTAASAARKSKRTITGVAASPMRARPR